MLDLCCPPVPEEDALQFISKEEYDHLKLLEKAASVKCFMNYCAYNPSFDWQAYLGGNTGTCEQ